MGIKKAHKMKSFERYMRWDEIINIEDERDLANTHLTFLQKKPEQMKQKKKQYNKRKPSLGGCVGGGGIKYLKKKTFQKNWIQNN